MSGAVPRGDAEHFERHGWVLLESMVDDERLVDLRQRASDFYPDAVTFAANPSEHHWLVDDPFGGVRWWPVGDPVLDALPLDPMVVRLARRLLGDRSVRLIRAGYHAKYAGAADYDQVLHVDYPNHSLVVPAAQDIVGVFVYLTDVRADTGPTMVVSSELTSTGLPLPTHLGPEQHRRIYAQEMAAVGRAGSVLAYSARTYHRGSELRAPGSMRLVLSVAYARPCAYSGYQSWPRLGEDPAFRAVIAEATPAQRVLLGFPGPRDAYWTPDAIEAIERRYPGIDMDPYRRSRSRQKFLEFS